VFANAGLEAWYRRKLVAMIRAMHDSIALHVETAYRNDAPQLGADSAVDLRKVLRKWGIRWTNKIEAMSEEIARAFARRSTRYTDIALRAAFDKAGWTVRFKPTRKSVEAYRVVQAENVNLIKSIPAQYLKDVQSAVWTSVMKGGALGDLSRHLLATYGVSVRRAALIARDQNNKAKAVMENVRRQELGVTEAVWLHSNAGKVPRPSHVAMSGKKFELAKGMWDADEQEWILPGQLINCRCSSRALLPGITLRD